MNNEEVKTHNVIIPHDFEGAILVGHDDRGNIVTVFVHRDDASDSIQLLPKNYVFPTKYDDNLGDTKVTVAQVV